MNLKDKMLTEANKCPSTFSSNKFSQSVDKCALDCINLSKKVSENKNGN